MRHHGALAAGHSACSPLSVAVIAVSLLTACSGSATPSSRVGASSPSQAAELPAERDIETTRAMKINAGPPPAWAFAAIGPPWLAGVDAGPPRFRAATG